MSGIELAGLVLGAFPILIHALERYRESAEVLKDWWQIQRAYRKCIHDIDYHRIIYEGNIERLLLSLVIDDGELKTLMDNPASEAWKNSKLESRLKECLPKSYNHFLDIMNDINRLMEALKEDLGVHDPQMQARINQHGDVKVTVSKKAKFSVSNIEYQAKRVRFSLKRSSRERLVMQLKDANERMRNLLENNDQITAARRRRESSGESLVVSGKSNEFRHHARRLHRALSKAWQCSCPSHAASLQLHHRATENADFDVLFNASLASSSESWKDIKIRMLPEGSIVGAVAPSNPQQASTRNLRQLPSIGKDWQIYDSSDLPNMAKIECLCDSLSRPCTGSFGFLDEDEHCFVVYPGDQTVASLGVEIITLEKLLCGASRILTRRKRYWLALTLASSYLQLSSTPWLNTPLQKDAIIFLKNPSNNGFLLIESPYVRSNLSINATAGVCDTMPALGIRLLELCFGTSLENIDFRQRLPLGDAISAPILDHTAAMQWCGTVTEEAGPEFADAIEWCLRTKERSDEYWRTEIWTHVVLPLEYCYKQVSQRLIHCSDV